MLHQLVTAAVVVAPNRDDTAVLATLTIREHNSTVHIVAAGKQQENLHLLRQGGADEVIDSTAAVGRMLGIATRAPGAIAVYDELLEAGSGIELEEIAGADDQTAPVTPADAVLVAVVRGDDSLRPADAGDPIPVTVSSYWATTAVRTIERDGQSVLVAHTA